MPAFGAKDVQELRKATGAGMMDAKKALTDADGDFEAAPRSFGRRAWPRQRAAATVTTAKA